MGKWDSLGANRKRKLAVLVIGLQFSLDPVLSSQPMFGTFQFRLWFHHPAVDPRHPHLVPVFPVIWSPFRQRPLTQQCWLGGRARGESSATSFLSSCARGRENHCVLHQLKRAGWLSSTPQTVPSLGSPRAGLTRNVLTNPDKVSGVVHGHTFLLSADSRHQVFF